MIQSSLKKTKIAICVSTYNRLVFLPRLFNSIASQKYKNYEVIVTDNSSTNDIENYISKSSFTFPIKYIRNNPTLSFAKNWTAGMHYSNSEWIKVMHDDDFFSTPDSLGEFANAITTNTHIIFSGYNAFYEENGNFINKTISQSIFKKIRTQPFLLLANNKIGNPSVVMFRNKGEHWYNSTLKWLVDLEAYIRMLQNNSCTYICKPLINISYNSTQVTNSCFRNPAIEIYEWLLVFQLYGLAATKPILVYDAWWRMIRNLGIQKEETLIMHARGLPIPDFIKKIIHLQRAIPRTLLTIGLVSKLAMSIAYVIHRYG